MTGSTTPSLRVGAKTHTGKVRSENQDGMSRFTSPLGEVFIVADGMGGHQGGQTAALMTVDGFDNYLRNAPPQCSVSEALQSAAQLTNEKVYELANSNDPTVAKMGSTVVLTVIDRDQMWVGHAGDSRAYLHRNGDLTRLTKDHSMVQKMIDHDMLTEEQARNHPDVSVIERAFGQQPHLELEISGPLELLPGDGVLLCTDGLCGYVVDDEIAAAMKRCGDAQEITAALIDLALATGGEDNVTVQYLHFKPTDDSVGSAVETRAVKQSTLRKVQRELRTHTIRSVLIVMLVMGVLGVFFVGMVVLIGTPRLVKRLWQTEPPPISTPSPVPTASPEPTMSLSETPIPKPSITEVPQQTQEQGSSEVAPDPKPTAPTGKPPEPETKKVPSTTPTPTASPTASPIKPTGPKS